MVFFKDSIKFYYFRDRQQVSLSFLGSPTHVLTFYMEHAQFEKIIREARQGVEVGDFFVLRKSDYLRFTYNPPGCLSQNLRVQLPKWDALIQDYLAKSAASDEPIITCVVP